MITPQMRNPPGRTAGFVRQQTKGDGLHGNHTTPAPMRAFRRELFIILDAAHKMAAGYGLAWSDYDRLHQAHEHVLRVLEAVHE